MRFTISSSDSTWAKSGLTVTSRTTPGRTSHLASAPTEASVSRGVVPSSCRSRLTPARPYGFTSRFSRDRGQAGEAEEVAGLAHPVEAALRPGPGAPERLLGLPPDQALDVQAPGPGGVRRGVAQGAEGDRELGRPAVLRSGGRRPGRRRRQSMFQAGLSSRHERVELGPVRVRGEEEGVAVVVEGVEDDRDPVVPRPGRPLVEARGHDLVALEDARRSPSPARASRARTPT